MKAAAHHRPASSLERAIALALPDPTTSVAILENAWGAAYHWISYRCIQKYQQHRDLAPGLNRLFCRPRGTTPGSVVAEY
jgi:hypothetical protein